MLKRAWYLINGVWALVWLAGASTRADGLLPGDLALAGAPLLLGWLAVCALRFVVTGSPLPRRGPVLFRRKL
jgi:hypothetical protein